MGLNISPSSDNWLSASTGVGGIYYQIVIRMGDASIKLIIDKNKELNKKIFDYLYEKKDEIEEVFGSEINWKRMDNQVSSRIEYDMDCCGLDDESTWVEGYEIITDTLIKWDKAAVPIPVAFFKS
jgi:hypothetical protein